MSGRQRLRCKDIEVREIGRQRVRGPLRRRVRNIEKERVRQRNRGIEVQSDRVIEGLGVQRYSDRESRDDRRFEVLMVREIEEQGVGGIEKYRDRWTDIHRGKKVGGLEAQAIRGLEGQGVSEIEVRVIKGQTYKGIEEKMNGQKTRRLGKI